MNDVDWLPVEQNVICDIGRPQTTMAMKHK